MDDHNQCILLWKRFVTWPSQILPGFVRPRDNRPKRTTQFKNPYFRPVLPNKSLTCVLTFMMRTINQPYLHIMRKSHFISPLIRLLCGAATLKNSHRQKSSVTLINYNSIFSNQKSFSKSMKRKTQKFFINSSAFLLLWNFQIFQKIRIFKNFSKANIRSF